MSARNISLVFGAISPSIQKQLAKQRIKISLSPHWQKDADAISRLYVRGLLTDSQVHSARGKLLKQIAKEATK